MNDKFDRYVSAKRYQEECTCYDEKQERGKAMVWKTLENFHGFPFWNVNIIINENSVAQRMP